MRYFTLESGPPSTTFIRLNVMSTVSLTLTFASLAEAAEFLSTYVPPQGRLAFEDRPDVGVSADEKAAVLAPFKAADTGFNPFAGQPTTVAAGSAVAQVPPPPAPSTAVVAVPPTAPEAPTSTATAPVPPVPAPPSAPVAAAPAAPAAPVSPAGIEVDADGLPWDARIHASGQKGARPKTADGRWRQKRGLGDGDGPALKARVEAELRQAMGAAASVPVVPTPVAPLPAPAVATTSAVPAPPAITVPSPAAAPVPAAEESAPQFLARVGVKLASGALTQERLAAVLQTVGLSTMAQLIVAPALIPAVRAQLDAA